MVRRSVSMQELINALEPELRRYYRHVITGKVTPMLHNAIIIALAATAQDEDDFIRKVRETYGDLAKQVKNVKIRIPTKKTPIKCTCGYPTTYEVNTLLSSGGAPLPHPTCPAGILTFYTTARINKNITITPNQITIPKTPTPSKNYKPIENTNQ